MRIHIKDAYHHLFVVVKDGAPLGRVRWADTDTMECCRLVSKDNMSDAGPFDLYNILRFDKLILMAVDIDVGKDIPADILEQAKLDPAIEVVVTPKDQKRVREEMGVFIPGVGDNRNAEE